jgi:glycosyltransferase involved in cell wall biosynthesis
MTNVRSTRLLQIFNRYRFKGGEEASVDRIYRSIAAIPEIEIERCLFHSQDWIDHPRPAWKQALHTIHNPEAVAVLQDQAAKFRPHALLVHNVLPVGSLGIYRWARDHEIPVIQYIHNFRPFSPGGSLWINNQIEDAALRGNPWPEILAGSWQNSCLKTAWMAFALRYARARGWFSSVRLWIAISDFMRDKFVAAGVPTDRIATLRHSFEFDEPPPETEDQGYYLWIGRLTPEKGVAVALRAWDIVAAQLGARTPRLVIAGEGSDVSLVRDAAARNPKIELAGFVEGERKARLLANCRAVLCTSLWWEPLGIVIYEAYNFSKPALASSSGGLNETVGEGRTGLVHQSGSSQELANQVMTFEHEPTSANIMGTAGRKWLLSNTRLAGWQESFLALLQTVVTSPHQTRHEI